MFLRSALRNWRPKVHRNLAQFDSFSTFSSSRNSNVSRDMSALVFSSLAVATAMNQYFNVEPVRLEAVVAQAEDDEEETTTVINWSGTHQIEVPNKSYFEPETR